jgi:hypothetical protein
MQLDLIETYYNIKPGKSKTCKICNKKKHIDSFGSMRTNKDRIDTRCKQKTKVSATAVEVHTISL